MNIGGGKGVDLLSVEYRKAVSSLMLKASLSPGLKTWTEGNHVGFEGTKERIKKMFDKVELSVSSYDTAWVAMVPSPYSSQAPYFPECVNWLLENQSHDGSWGLPHPHPMLVKDALSSTLASVLALKRWGVGEEQRNKGLWFIASNFASVSDEKQHSPIGFDIIFPGMIEYAKELDLNLPLGQRDVDAMLQKRDLELKGSLGSNTKSREAYLAYISEGMGRLQDWEMVMKYQMKNGSLLNSPSATAAALSHLQNAGCLNYLRSLLEKFGNAGWELIGILGWRSEVYWDETYRCWLQREEEIFADRATCAIAFRILRLNGYDISSVPLAQFAEDDQYFKFGQDFKDLGAALELFRASEMIIHPDEVVLEKQNSWSSHFLRQGLSNSSIHADRLNKYIAQEVEDALRFPYYANLDRIANRRSIEHYNVDDTRILKTAYRWIIENRLDKLKFARQKLAYCYFSAAATIFSPEQSDARLSWAKNSVLTTVVDDFFDIGGSEEGAPKPYSTALHSTISEIGVKASAWQARNVTSHIIDIWLKLLRSMLQEAQWVSNKSAPTMDEYMTNAYVSFALGPIVLPALYFVGPKLSEEVVEGPECHKLYKLMSTCGRLLNDIHSFKRESKEGKANALALHMIHGNGVTTEEQAIREMKGLVKSQRRELQRLVLQEKGSTVPRICKDLFWKMSKVLHTFYEKDDGFTSHDMLRAVKSVIYEPVLLAEF
ncbi:Ent-kaur-16-ene synthase, chloroplastic [Vitis vinifera]|uniref:Ent-kaur-16-ene synthase, chloroplastic n=1 Tax=Vitis vinifera TaxID=29760 RepID=A0A438IAW7_VITVI|nr:Ent-kaur-16-ene synthase, chloroplastic [Vitis vinifera]